MDIRRLSQKLAAELLAVTPRTLRDWSDAPRNPDGSYDGPALVAWLLSRDRTGGLDPTQERARRDADRIAALLPAWGRALKAATVAEVRDLVNRGKLA